HGWGTLERGPAMMAPGQPGSKLNSSISEGSKQLSSRRAQIVGIVSRRLASQFSPNRHRLHDIGHALGKTSRRVIAPPAAALIKPGIIDKPTLGKVEPAARHLVEAWSRLGRHEGSAAVRCKMTPTQRL